MIDAVADTQPSHARRVIDVFLFYKELDLLELRFRALYDHVDFFVVTECEETFSGKPKPMYFAENRDRFAAFEDKIIYNAVDKDTLSELQGADWQKYVTSPDAVRAHKHNMRPPRQLRASLKREITHRDAAVKGLASVARPDDLILLSDVDELPDARVIGRLRDQAVERPSYFQMRWSLYYINNLVDAPWFGTVAFTYDMLEGQSLDLLRYASSNPAGLPGPPIADAGWHFSYLGGSDAIQDKLRALPYQGMRAELAKVLSRFRRGAWQKSIDGNADILLQNRTLRTVAIDDSFPAEIFQIRGFIEKYARSTSEPVNAGAA
ncbi:hypothetical protein [Martelella limonii]|uniref:hypothetical protein n=1 Tax=Martelella limonii TaxID=1647649 RepID=UPI0015808B59